MIENLQHDKKLALSKFFFHNRAYYGAWKGILVNSAKNYTLTGRVLDEYSIPLSGDGWYMVGGCTDPAQASVVNCTISVIYGYSKIYGYQRVASDQLVPGNGYWILIKNAGERAELNVKANVREGQYK